MPFEDEETIIPDELSTEEILKLNNKISLTMWEEWLNTKWRKVTNG
jgi:hypothetical protein